jgi:Mor family transcriptional regulator
MSRTPENLTELRIRLSPPLVISLFQMAADGLVPANAKRVETFISQLIESAVADFRLKELLKKNETKRKAYYLKPQIADASFNHRTKISAAVTQKILHASSSHGMTISELSRRFNVSRACIGNILSKFADSPHTQTPLGGNRKRGNFPEINLST